MDHTESISGFQPLRESSLLTFAIFFSCCTVLAVGISIYSLGLLQPHTMVLFEAAEVFVIAALSIAMGRVGGAPFDFFSPATLVNISFVLNYSLRGTYLVISRDTSSFFSGLNPARDPDYVLAMGYGVLGLLGFHAGYYCFSSKTNPVAKQRVWNRTRLARVAIVGGLWAVLSAFMSFVVAGGISGTLNNIGRLREVTVGYAYLTIGTAFFPIVTLLLFVDHLLGNRRPFWVGSFTLMTIGYAAIVGNRTGMFTIVLAMLVTYVYIRGIRNPWKATVAALLIVSILVPLVIFWGVARQENVDASDIVKIAERLWDSDSQLFGSMLMNEFVSLDSFAAVLHGGPQVFPFKYGKTYLDVLLFVVPRAVWHDKPVAFSTAVGDYVTLDNNDVPPGVVGELYVNFHVFGVFFGMLFLGMFMHRIYDRGRNSGYGAIAVYALLAPYFWVFLSRNFIGGGILILTSVLPMLPVVAYIQRVSTQPVEARS